jgi:hypothetical protein
MTRPCGVARIVSYTLVAWLLTSAAARAELTTIDGVEAPIVRIQIPAQANLTIRTWDRATVQIDGDASAYTVDRSMNRVPANLPPTLIRVGQTNGPSGPISLPAESFVVSTLPPGPRAVVLIKGQAGHSVGPITVTIPANTALLAGNVARGSIALQNYQNGTFILHLNNGFATIDGAGGDGFIQVLHGPLFVSDSTFNRLRARSAVGLQVYERCSVRQIEASSVNGSIVYDNGRFDPGLARFDVTNGNVALGTNRAAQLNGHVAGGGRVYTLFERRAQIDARESDASAIVDGGGPLATATSANGNVYLYDGSLRTKTRIPAEWQAARAALRREGNALPSSSPPIEQPKPQSKPPPPNPEPPRKKSGGKKSFRLP